MRQGETKPIGLPPSARAGLGNTLDHVCQASDTRQIRAVIGGLHLSHASAARIERSAADLASRDIELLVPCHCTGEDATGALQRILGERISVGHAGDRYIM